MLPNNVSLLSASGAATTNRSSRSSRRCPASVLNSNVLATSDSQPIGFTKALVAGGLSGTTVDIALFPIDTLKTRLQSPRGFWAAGGFNGVFRGVGATALGSAPGAALFFGTYETLKPILIQQKYTANPMVSHMISAACGETVSCLVRVPTEVLKTKMQINQPGTESLLSTLKLVLSQPGGGLYRGFGITLMREIPFALIQFPIYEKTKHDWARYQGFAVSPLQAAACGSFGGAIAAAVTTPLDVLKTRIMIGQDAQGIRYLGLMDVLEKIWTTESKPPFRVLFSGIQPRVMWISIGGFVFFGAYETYKTILPFHP